MQTQQETGGLVELTDAGLSSIRDSPLYNPDIAPTRIREREWGTYGSDR